jgi:two-component system chemotaxis response regulator CheB
LKHDIAVIGASAGGVQALTSVVSGLPPHHAGSILIALHVSGQSVLPDILGRHSSIPVSHARDGEPIAPNHIYVAPPGQHLIVERGHVGLSHSARENGHRPAIDPLFRTAARVYRDRVVGVVLSGQLDDGAAGLFTVKSRGGLAIVQDPGTAVAPSMPRAAGRYTKADFCLAPEAIGPLLGKLARGKGAPRVARGASKAARRARAGNGHHRQVPFGCPDCQGPLYEIRDGELARYTCEVGHSFSPESLDQAQKDALERALWIAARSLRERALAEPFFTHHAGRDASSIVRNRLLEHADQAEADLELIRQILDRF